MNKLRSCYMAVETAGHLKTTPEGMSWTSKICRGLISKLYRFKISDKIKMIIIYLIFNRIKEIILGNGRKSHQEIQV